jgi:hypothetical protein
MLLMLSAALLWGCEGGGYYSPSVHSTGACAVPNYSGSQEGYGGSTSIVTPNYIGGANVQTIGPDGGSSSIITPNYMGGYNVQTIDQ